MGRIEEITVVQANTKWKEKTAVFVDVRDSSSYKKSHIPGAILLDDRGLMDFLEQTDKKSTVIVYCYHGFSSISAAQFIKEKGFDEVLSMKGGFSGWRLANLEMESSSSGS